MLGLCTAGVEAKAAGAERDNLQKTAGHRHVLEEMDELVLVSQIAVEDNCRRYREGGEDRRRDARVADKPVSFVMKIVPPASSAGAAEQK